MKQIFFSFFIAILAINVEGQNMTNTPSETEAVTNLIFAIRQQPQSEEGYTNKEAAIKEAGETHNTNPQVIQALLDNILYQVRRPGPGFFNPMEAPKFSIFPAGDALLMIGEPVIPILIERLKITDDKNMRARYVSLLRQKELAGSRSFELIKKAMAELSEQELEQKARLEKSLELLR